MKIKKELITREIAGETILVPVGKSVLESNGLFALNEVGAFIWNLLPRAENEEAICRAVLDAYDVSPEEAARDVAEFLKKLEKMQII